jgi:hypothetical protein
MSLIQTRRRTGLSGQTIFLLAVVIASCLAVVYVVFYQDRTRTTAAQPVASKLRLEEIPFNGARAYGYLKQLCALGSRSSGTPGMAEQQKILIEHFQKAGAQVDLQRFTTVHPENGTLVPMANLIAHFHPERKERVLLAAHYDTLPYPLMDPVDKHGLFVGANDGCSGVAILMELAHDLPTLKTRFGVDIVMFDAEEYVFRRDGVYFLGAEYFSRQYVESRPAYRYRWGVLLDMVGSSDLHLYEEGNSLWWKDTRPLVESLWGTAQRLGVREFIRQKKYEMEDDHLPLHNTGHIPTCDVIDFDYPPWHTRGDTPDKCSALSLAKVGWVLREWLVTAGK